MTKHSMKISPEKLIIERGRRLAIHECYMEKQNILEYGEGSVIVARSHKGGKYTIAVFLLDTYCLGIKDTFYRVLLEEHEYNGLIDQYKTYCTLEKIEYTEAHNWIFGALEFAYDAGIKPHKDFAVTQYLLEDDEDESIPIIEYGFGKNGKHFLVAHSKAEADLYIPVLRQHLGNDFNFIVEEKGPFGQDYTSETMYTHKHGKYPDTLDIKNIQLMEFIDKLKDSLPTKEDIDKVIGSDRETLKTGLQNLILFETGRTCNGIREEWCENQVPLMIYSLFLLGEAGDETSIDTVLEVLRQNEDYMDYHFGDYAEQTFTPVLHKLAKDRLDIMSDFMKEQGLYTYAKSLIFPVVTSIAAIYPQRRDKIIGWYRDILNFFISELPKGTAYCDGTLAGLAVSYAMDIKPSELLPEIEALYRTGLVDIMQNGKFEDVRNNIERHDGFAMTADPELDIYREFDALHDFCRQGQ